MQKMFCNIKVEKVKSEKGFTFLELIMVMVVTGILSSTLILPFASSIKHATRPEIYNTATYIAVGELERKRGNGYTTASGSVGTPSITTVTKKLRNYTKTVVTDYVSHSAGNFSFSATPTEYIRVTVTISNPGIEDISMSELLTEDFFNPYIN